MTLIAFALYGDRAELITDTAAYSAGGRTFGHRTKFAVLPHLDAVIATQGSNNFGTIARAEANQIDATYDTALRLMPDRLREAWTNTGAQREGDEGSAFLIGHSPEEGRPVAHRFLAEHDFEPEQVDGMSYLPAPLAYRPLPFESARLRAALGDLPLLDEWDAQPSPTAPTSREEWVDLALEVRATRAMWQSDAKVFVAGKLLWTRIAKGRIRTEVIHEFNDTGDELDEMVAGTLHPRGQIGHCPCGSGARALDCHIAQAADAPCPCASESTFAECCMLTPGEAIAAETMGLIA